MSTPPIEKFVGGIPVIPKRLNGNQTGMKEFADNLFCKMDHVGFQSVRFAFFWDYNPNGEYVRDYIDLVLSEAQQRGFRCYGMILPPNNPAHVGWTPPNIVPQTRLTFLDMVKRYGRNHGNQIEYWEVLNEVNQSVVDERGNIRERWYEGTAYASLLRDTYLALLEGFRERDDYAALVLDRGEPPFKLYAAGTSGTDIAWIEMVCVGLERLYSDPQYSGEGKYINGFSIHPFSNNVGPDEHFLACAPTDPGVGTQISHGTLAANIDWATHTLAKHPNVPQDLFAGEYGWSTFANPPSDAIIVPEHAQGVYVSQGFIEAHASGKLSQAIWAWTFIDMDAEWNYWDHTGALRTDGDTEKESYSAIKTAIGKLSGMEMRQNLSWMLPGNGRMFLYQSADKTSLVFWSSVASQLTVKVKKATTFRTYDHLGKRLNEFTNRALVNVNVIASPHYLEFQGPPLTFIQGIEVKPNGLPMLPKDWGLRPVKRDTARASNFVTGAQPQKAFDNKEVTFWSSGQFPTQWIEVEFQRPETVAGMILTPIQMPAGMTEHEIFFHIGGSYQSVRRLSSHTAHGMKIVIKFPTPHQNVRKMKVQTTASPSWVGWFEIGAYAP